MSESTRQCPICAEEVKNEAIKCKHCGSLIQVEEWQLLALRWDSIPQKDRDEEWLRIPRDRRIQFLAILQTLRPRRIVVDFAKSGCWWALVFGLGLLGAAMIASNLR